MYSICNAVRGVDYNTIFVTCAFRIRYVGNNDRLTPFIIIVLHSAFNILRTRRDGPTAGVYYFIPNVIYLPGPVLLDQSRALANRNARICHVKRTADVNFAREFVDTNLGVSPTNGRALRPRNFGVRGVRTFYVTVETTRSPFSGSSFL